MKQLVIDFDPIGTKVTADSPVLLRDAAARAGVPIKSVCGGKGTCGKCLVRVTGTALSPVTAGERRLLSDAEISAGYRQACCTVTSGDASVHILPSSLLEEQWVRIEGVEATVAVDPIVSKVRVLVPPATLADQRGDWDRAVAALRVQPPHLADLPTLVQLSATLRTSSHRTAADREVTGIETTVALRQGELIAAEAGDTTGTSIGMAVDLGTTKIACYLVDLLTGRTLAAQGVMNPQIAYGDDVIARIEAASRDEATHRHLQKIFIDCINGAAADLCAITGTRPGDILEMSIVGNTAMHHLALGLPVRQLGVAPFAAVTGQPLDVKCSQLGLVAAPGGYVHFPPVVAGFVGSDHVAVLLASAFGQDGRTRLVVDLGTNTEIALQSAGQIRSCSTACGPAFEGGHVRFGMRAAPGAIDHVKIDAVSATVQVTTIGSKPPVGICGSGILDAVAELLQVGWLDGHGRLNSGAAPIRSGRDGQEVVLAHGQAEDPARREIVLTQRDLSEIQLAKGAIRAACNILMEEMAVEPEDIDEVVLAGAFGTYLDPGSAMRLGLFPPVSLSRIHQVGNAAGVGARQALISRQARAEAGRLARAVRCLELTVHPHFAERFAAGMSYSPEKQGIRQAREG